MFDRIIIPPTPSYPPPGPYNNNIMITLCRDCMGEAHEPCSCEEWKKWLDLIEEMRPKVGDKTSAESDEAASFRWLASRSKPCPKCK